MTTDLRTLTDETRVVIEFEPVRAPDTRRTLETRVEETGLTPDDPNVVELAEFHSEKDRYPRRRLMNVRNPDADLRLEARRSGENGATFALFGRDVTVLETGEPEPEPAEADGDAAPAVTPVSDD